MRSELFLTILTLLIVLGEFNNKTLLQIDISDNFFLDRDFDFDPSGMWFSINKTRINDFDLE